MGDVAALQPVRKPGKTERLLIFVWWFLVRLLFIHCMPAGRHSDSTPDSRRVRLFSRLPCGSYGAGSPTAVVCSGELVSFWERGNSMPYSSGYPRPCGFSLHTGSFHMRAFVSCVFRREKSSITRRRILISFGFSGLPRAPHLCVTTDSRCLTRVNVRQPQKTTSKYVGMFHALYKYIICYLSGRQILSGKPAQIFVWKQILS